MMKENECNVFEEKAKQNSEMELKRINEIKEKLECDLNITEDEMRDMIRTFRKSTNSIQGENIMKYTEEEIKAMYEYDKMIEGIFLDFDEYRKILKKALKKSKYFSFLKILANIII